jgi:hypothetical protein
MAVHETPVDVQPFFDLTHLMDPRVRISFTKHPGAIEKGLHHIALFEWAGNFGETRLGARPVKREESDSLFLPHVPFVLETSDSLIGQPRRGPDTADLAREPYYDNDGEVIGEKPVTAFYLDAKETEQFEGFLQKHSGLMTTIEPHKVHWMFLNTALGFLLKAFTTDDLEQLLWHITAIEAVLGQKVDSGLTKMLANRLVQIFGGTKNERADLRKRFEELYSFRSDLVHGNASLTDKKIMKGHLLEARDLARSTLVWMIGYLAHVAKHLPPGVEEPPSREHLLQLLDLDSQGRESFLNVLKGLPKEFPAVADWS